VRQAERDRNRDHAGEPWCAAEQPLDAAMTWRAITVRRMDGAVAPAALRR